MEGWSVKRYLFMTFLWSLTKGIQYTIDVYIAFSKKLYKPRLEVAQLATVRTQSPDYNLPNIMQVQKKNKKTIEMKASLVQE